MVASICAGMMLVSSVLGFMASLAAASAAMESADTMASRSQEEYDGSLGVIGRVSLNDESRASLNAAENILQDLPEEDFRGRSSAARAKLQNRGSGGANPSLPPRRARSSGSIWSTA